MINAEISFQDLKELQTKLDETKRNILKDIWIRYLYNTVDKEEFINEFLGNKSKPKIINNKKEPCNKIDLTKCMARIWKNGVASQCSLSKLERIDYCRTHLTKRNYGRIDEEIINE